MAKNFGKPNNHTVEIGRQQAQQVDANSDKFRIAGAHIHIIALACAMVGACFHIIMTYEDLKKERYHRLIRHVPCALLFILVIAGNRLYKSFMYFFYLILYFPFVVYIIVAEIIRQYMIRTDPKLNTHPRHSIMFFVAVWCIMFFVEVIIYFIIYKDYKFTKEVQSNPPENIQFINSKDRTAPVTTRY